MMQASIAICTWNRAELLAQTLDQMTRLVVAPEVEWEVLVVNNNCTDSTDDVIREFSSRLPLRRVFESRPGLSNARNAAIAQARAQWLLFTDDDVLVDANWVSACLRTAEHHPTAAAIGGPIEPWFPVPPDELLVRVFPTLGTGFCGIDHGPVERVLEAEDLYGANMAYNLTRIGKLRFLDALGPKKDSAKTGDDVDFVRRVRRNGGDVVWSPNMKVRHYVAPSRMTVDYQAKWLTDWARTEVRRVGLSAIPPGPLLAGVPRWLWGSTASSYLRWQMAKLGSSRENALTRLKEHSIFKGWLLECRAMAREGVPAGSSVGEAAQGS